MCMKYLSIPHRSLLHISYYQYELNNGMLYLVIHGGYEGGDITEKNNPPYSCISYIRNFHESSKKAFNCLYLFIIVKHKVKFTKLLLMCISTVSKRNRQIVFYGNLGLTSS